MIAEYERAQIPERTRRGKLHRARTGHQAVMAGAPYGYRFVKKTVYIADGYWEINESEGRGRARDLPPLPNRGWLLIGALARWLSEQVFYALYRQGGVGIAGGCGGCSCNPAYHGQAAYGKKTKAADRHGGSRRATTRARGERRGRPPSAPG